jgi:hypothetical protein
VLAALWLRQPPPPEYLELLLCRDVYHCPPTELARVPLATVLAHLACLDAEAQVREAEMRSARHGQ